MSADDEDSPTIIIDPAGDVVITIADERYPLSTASYRIKSEKLQNCSPYFKRLIGSSSFSEGANIQAQLVQLHKKYQDAKDAPTAELPSVNVDHIGQIGKVKDIRGLMTDFFRINHDLGISGGHLSVPLTNLANLCIVCDRFDSLEILKRYVISNNIFAGTQRRKSLPARDTWNEERSRMRMLVAVLLNHAPWFEDTAQLIAKGSRVWAEPEDTADRALWWDLPMIEDELKCRRSAIISTISSLLSHCVSLYTSGTLQCKLGYSNSLQCDVYQLGEIVKFFNRLGLMTLESTMAGTDGRDPFDGDIIKAFELLRQVPAYQIDKDHAHCGLRNRLIPSIDDIQTRLNQLAICGDCWSTDRAALLWTSAKKPLIFSSQSSQDETRRRIMRTSKLGHTCTKSHERIRDLCLSVDKNWKIPR
ncbi:hypothetical protein BT63DRAFT_451718 [Microthyrium microscopicum]|uniref:BTB domain-containing protein n=1 Tax=Microthyrium microscopicum TaxID=703497 RepID=A0A6A6UQE1_9PEZI|nr:hypothetical protein BT63DRAFT_451718 [Microthyrium microscopicum]